MPNIDTPKWSALLAEMRSFGMTQAEIAAAVRLSQATVSDMLSGKIKTTEYSRGLRILAAHRKAKRASEKASA